jgi:signal transduction histidine kinase
MAIWAVLAPKVSYLTKLLRSLDPDRLLPLAIRAGDAETLRKARIALYFAMALLAQCAIYIPKYALEGYSAPAIHIAIGGALLLFLPLTLRLPRPLSWAGLQIGSLTLAVLTSTAVYSGGLHSTSLWWMCMVPILALLVSGKRLALLMAATQIAIVLVFDRMTSAGHVWPAGPDPITHPEVILWDVVLLMATLLALAWLFEKAKERTLDALGTYNRELQLILDSVGQGFLSCDLSGTVVGRHSTIVRRWFGQEVQGQKIWTYLTPSDEVFSGCLEFGWSALVDDFLPIELCLDQLPKRFTREGRTFQLEYRPVKAGEQLLQIALVVTDITAIMEMEREEAEQRELAVALNCALADRAGFLQFIEEGENLVARLDPTAPDLQRTLHTIKGNCGFYGARSVAAASHALEDRLAYGSLEAAEIEPLKALWRAFCERLSLIIDTRAGVIEIAREDFDALRNAVRAAAHPTVLDRMVTELVCEPVEDALARSAAHARALARRLDKGDLDIEIDACDIRLDPRRWKPVWSAFDHAMRNAVDHGLESASEREELGKSPAGRLQLGAKLNGDELVISITDDGRGVNWEQVRERARSRGIPHTTRAELESALFIEGLTTRDMATAVSGRGVGLNALSTAVRSLGGRIEVSSERGQGTTFRMHFPEASRWSLPPLDAQSAQAA